MSYIRRKQINILLIVILVILCDQISKFYIVYNFELHKVFYVTSFFNLVHALNKGVSFGMFHSYDLPKHFFTLINFNIVLILITWSLKTEEPHVEKYCALMIGGALGNISDRCVRGAVIDFLDFHISHYHYPAFNIADSAICIGAFLILISPCFRKESRG